MGGLQTSYDSYQRWTKAAKERAKFLQATYSLADMFDGDDSANKHRNNRTAEKRHSEKQVTRAVTAIQAFSDPFRIADTDRLFSISSGAPASAVVEDDVLRAEAAGLLAKEEFIEERLVKSINSLTLSNA